MNINELRQKRGEAVAAMRGILDRAEADGRNLNSDEETQYQAFDKEQSDLKARIERLSAQADLDKGIDELQQDVVANRLPIAEASARKAKFCGKAIALSVGKDGRSYLAPNSVKNQLEAFDAFLRRGRNGVGHEVLNALEVGTNSEGGFITPQEFDTALVEAMQDINEIRNVATVISTGSDRNIPIESTLGVSTWTAEEAAYTESDPEFGRVILEAHKLGRIVKVSEELLFDAFFDVGGYLVRNFAKSHGIAEEAAFVNGDGSGKPTGIVQGATANNTDAAGSAAITADELIDVYHALPRPYRMNATWLANDSTVKLIRKLKDGDNQYLWQPGIQAGQPDSILGRPFVASTAMPAATTGNVSVVFGDMSYYTIADRQNSVMQRLDELYAANGQVGFRHFKRTEGKVTLADAFAKLTQA